MAPSDQTEGSIWAEMAPPPGTVWAAPPPDPAWAALVEPGTPAPQPPEPAPAPAPAAERAEDPRVFAPSLHGHNYQAVLESIHRELRPATYLEIGLMHGDTFALAKCASVGVDTELRIATTALAGKPRIHLFQTTSDRFFAEQDPTALLGGPVELAFLDGMHLFEFLLRDFMNTEAHCRPNSIIALHDCVPTDVGMTRRDPYAAIEGMTRNPGMWTGDVWKIVPILRKYRPGLRIHVLDAPSTGLVLVTGLDPASTVLRERYFDIVAEAMAMDLAGIGIDSQRAGLDLRSTHDFMGLTRLAQHFWL